MFKGFDNINSFFSCEFKLEVKFKLLQNKKWMLAVKEATWSKFHDAV